MESKTEEGREDLIHFYQQDFFLFPFLLYKPWVLGLFRSAPHKTKKEAPPAAATRKPRSNWGRSGVDPKLTRAHLSMKVKLSRNQAWIRPLGDDRS